MIYENVLETILIMLWFGMGAAIIYKEIKYEKLKTRFRRLVRKHRVLSDASMALVIHHVDLQTAFDIEEKDNDELRKKLSRAHRKRDAKGRFL